MLATGDGATAIVEREGLKQESDSGAIEAAVDQVLAANADKVAEYRGRERGAVRLLRRPDDEGDAGQGEPAGSQRGAEGEAGVGGNVCIRPIADILDLTVGFPIEDFDILCDQSGMRLASSVLFLAFVATPAFAIHAPFCAALKGLKDEAALSASPQRMASSRRGDAICLWAILLTSAIGKLAERYPWRRW